MPKKSELYIISGGLPENILKRRLDSGNQMIGESLSQWLKEKRQKEFIFSSVFSSFFGRCKNRKA